MPAYLKQVWQLAKAQSIYDRISALGPDKSAITERLSPYIQVLATGTAVIETGVPVSTVLNAARAIGSSVPARFMINALDPVQCGGTKVNPEQIVAKYEQVRCADDDTSLPSARWSRVHWLTSTSIEEVDLVTFGDRNCAESNELQFGFKVLSAHVQSVIVPVVLFDPALDTPASTESSSPILNNADSGSKVCSNGRLSRIHQAAYQALRRLMTHALSGQRK